MKETSFKMESGSTGGGPLNYIPLTAAYITSKKKEDNYFDKRGHFSYRNLSPVFKNRKIPAPPSKTH